MLESIEVSQFINQSPQKVWEALTIPELLQQWWAKGNIQPYIDHQFTLDMGSFGQQLCLVTLVEKELLFEYIFAIGVLDTTIRWQLNQQDNGTLLQFNHSGFNVDFSVGQQAFIGMGKGWPQILNRIESVISYNK